MIPASASHILIVRFFILTMKGSTSLVFWRGHSPLALRAPSHLPHSLEVLRLERSSEQSSVVFSLS